MGLPRRGERLTDPDPPSLPKAEFGFAGTELRRQLVDAILRGEKTAGTGLLADYQRDGDEPGSPGERQLLVDFDDRPVAIIEITDVTIRRMADVDLEFAIAEGEGFASVADWRAAHERFFGSYIEEIRSGVGDPEWQLTDDTLVTCERFQVVQRL